ncbi:flagellar biosynthetic protein FliO [Heyndrickxia sp. NPDC080065]|uniref:flagellar biosynthetic protein FliO n=1 Tax=Heyndrickxia sp. NPDC080065 TaxID=3390568 RepID=UPI003D02FFD2
MKKENPQSVKKADKVETTNSSIITFWDGAKMVFALIFVIGLLYFLLKFINKKSQSYQQNRLIQNFGGTPLGGNRSLQVVKAGNRILILGVGEDITLLKEIEDKKEIDEFIQFYKDQLDHSLEPRDIISKLTNRNKNSKSNNLSFQNILNNQLANMKKDRKNVMSKFDQKEQKTDE